MTIFFASQTWIKLLTPKMLKQVAMLIPSPDKEGGLAPRRVLDHWQFAICNHKNARFRSISPVKGKEEEEADMN